MMARAVAKQCKATFLNISASTIQNKCTHQHAAHTSLLEPARVSSTTVI